MFPGAKIIINRGCSYQYQCSYCDRSVFKRDYRYNSPVYIYHRRSGPGGFIYEATGIGGFFTRGAFVELTIQAQA
jgi:hypothetical protein